MIPANVISATLTFMYSYQNYNTDFNTPSPETLDIYGDPNQQLRIDIMTSSSDPFSVAFADVLLNIFQSQGGDPLNQPYTTYSVDLTPFAGQTIRLRFAGAANQFFLNFEVDEVSIITEAPTMSPASLQGCQTIIDNNTNIVDILAWTPPITGTVTAFNIYRNSFSPAGLIATVPNALPLTYGDQHLASGTTNTYFVTAVGPGGESAPIAITIPAVY